MLWESMRKENSLYLITHHLNQDPLENFFAILRNRCRNNDNPSAMEFRRNLQYTMTANLMKPPIGTNCEIDDTNSLLLTTPNFDYEDDVNISKDIEMWIDGEDAIRFESANVNL